MLNPLIWILILLGISLFSKKSRLKRGCLGWGFLALVVLTNPGLYQWVAGKWESKPVFEEQLKPHYTYVVVPGGYAGWDRKAEKIQVHESADRLIHAIRFLETGRVDTIILTGGSSRILLKERKEADVVRDLLLELNIDPGRIKIDPVSRNTHENAQYSAKLVQSNPDSINILLITSAFHMPRAIRCYQKAGISPDTYPVHYITDRGPLNPFSWFVPRAETISGWSLLMKEWIGFLGYQVKGYI